jgi:hypothetical protein
MDVDEICSEYGKCVFLSKSGPVATTEITGSYTRELDKRRVRVNESDYVTTQPT